MVQLRQSYESSDLVVQVRSDWIANMLEDIGVADSECDGKLQIAVRRYIEGEAQNAKDNDIDLTMGELEALAHAYWNGYEQCLCDSGKMSPNGIDTFEPYEGTEG